MRIPIRAGLLALVLAAAGWSHARAQPIDEDACRSACYEEQSACVSRCGEHDDPVECEGHCRDAVEDCLAECD